MDQLHEAALEPIRCGRRDRCPACRRHELCPLDTWPDTVAAAALGDAERYARGFFETTGKEAGTGAYTSWCAKGAQIVADTAVALCIDHWRRIGQPTRAEQVAQLAWNAGCRHPDVVDADAGQIAAAGSITDLRTALAACKLALRARRGSSHDAWNRLQARSHQLAGQLERLRIRPSGRFDADGNPIPLRRHHPTTPHRSRPRRFQRSERSRRRPRTWELHDDAAQNREIGDGPVPGLGVRTPLQIQQSRGHPRPAPMGQDRSSPCRAAGNLGGPRRELDSCSVPGRTRRTEPPSCKEKTHERDASGE